VSTAGLGDTSVASSNNGSAPNKRPFLANAGGQRNDHLEKEFKRKELLAQQAYERLQQELNAKGRELEKQQEERLALLRQWESLSAEFHEERRRFSEEKKSFQERSHKLQGRNNELSSKVDEAESERDQAALTLQNLKTENGIRIAALEAQLSEAKAAIESERESKDVVRAELQAREEEWSAEREKLRMSRNDTEEASRLTAELSDMLSKMRRMEHENAVLKQENSQLQSRKDSIEVLKEQKRDLEKKVAGLDELRRSLAESETKIADLQSEKSQWDSAMQHSQDSQAYERIFALCSDPEADIPKIVAPDSKTSASISEFVSGLEGAVAGLVKRAQILADRSRNLRIQLQSSEEESQQQLERIEALTYDLESSKTASLKAQKRNETLGIEVQGYKRLLETYQEEAKSMSTQFDTASNEQIKLLQEQLTSRQADNESMSTELERLRSKVSHLAAPGGQTADEKRDMEAAHEESQKELMQLIKQKDEAYEELERQCVSLGKSNDDLFARLGRGEFDQSKLRVLELTNNPVSQDRVIRTSMLDALRKENAELLVQVKELSEKVGGIHSALVDGNESVTMSSLIPVQSLNNLQSEHDKLRQAMRDRDKAFDRLKEVFAAKATEYVAAVKALFGYDMHVISLGKVKLRSVYARTAKGTSLTFDSGEEGDVANMRLIGEARQGAANVANLKRYWLGADRSSVPCFLAALQLELYESTTQAVRVGWTEDDDAS
jgi:mitotic spindle assembly checkpoint protein MAD1